MDPSRAEARLTPASGGEATGTEAPVDGHRVAARTGLDVDKPDVEALAADRLRAAADSYEGWPLWDCRALDALEVDQVAAVVAERQVIPAGTYITAIWLREGRTSRYAIRATGRRTMARRCWKVVMTWGECGGR